jgi:hypothetical protein
MADRVQTLASSKENELARLRNEVRAAQAAAAAGPPKKVVVDDTEPAKKPLRKKRVAKHPAKSANGQPQNKTANPQPQGAGSSPQ